MLLCSKGVFSDFSRRSLRNITSLVRFCTMADRLTLFQSIGLTRGKAQDTVKNEGLSKRLESVILQVGYSTLDRFHLLFIYVFPRPFCANSVQIFETNIRAPSWCNNMRPEKNSAERIRVKSLILNPLKSKAYLSILSLYPEQRLLKLSIFIPSPLPLPPGSCSLAGGGVV